MANFYIDYENVGCAGLKGIEKLSEEDEVLIFYSSKANTMSLECVETFCKSPVKKTFIKSEVIGTNALDFQILTYLFYHLGKNNIQTMSYIVSKDTGFDVAVNTAKNKLQLSVARILDIDMIFKDNNQTTEEIQKELQTKINQILLTHDIEITNEINDAVFSGIQTTNDKNEFFHFLNAQLGDMGIEIYRKIRDRYDDMKNIFYRKSMLTMQ